MVNRALDAWGRAAINTSSTSAACMDKAETSLRLARVGVPTPRSRVAFDPETALDGLGYPAVIKPVTGSWARLVSRARRCRPAVAGHRRPGPTPGGRRAGGAR